MRTDLHALAAFVRRCVDEDAERYRQAIRDGDTWVRTSPGGLVNGGENALRDLEVAISIMSEHEPCGPDLCDRCSEHYDWPVAFPCYWVRIYLGNWSDRDGWWPGWSNRGRPHGHPNAHIHTHRIGGLIDSRLFDARMAEPVEDGRPARADCAWIAHVDGRARECQCGTHAGQRADVWSPIGGRERLSVPDRPSWFGYLGEEQRRYESDRVTGRLRWFL